MSAYIQTLQAAVERDQARVEQERAERERTSKNAARERLTPLEDRLKRLLSTIPIAVQREGLSLSVLQASLKGRWRGNAHPGEVGRALRSLGFKASRIHDLTRGSRVLWFPRKAEPV